MTTIAYRDGILAADSASWDVNDIYFGRTSKIHKLRGMDKLSGTRDGGLLAGAGSNSMLLRVADWLNGICDRPTADDDKPTDRFEGLLIRPGRRVYYIDQSLAQSELVDIPFVAIGSGRELALGAMAMGATAREAVMIACQFDANSRGPVDVEEMPPGEEHRFQTKSSPSPSDTCDGCGVVRAGVEDNRVPYFCTQKPQSPAQEAALTCYWAASDPFQAKVARALMLLSGLPAE